MLAGAFEWPEFETIRRVTFGIIGLAPIAFLIGLLSEHLSRSTLGDLLVKLRARSWPGRPPRGSRATLSATSR